MAKNWNEVTVKEINENKRKWCVKCVYSCGWGNISVENLICDYRGKTNCSRGCSPLECDKFVPRRGYKPKRFKIGEE